MLTSSPFSGCLEVRGQLTHPATVVREIDEEGSLAIKVGSHSERIPSAARVPVEAVAVDLDGMPVRALLHVENGLATEIEILRDDGLPLKTARHSLVWRLERWQKR